jgi:hypothetical protein
MSHEPAVWQAIPILEFLKNVWGLMANAPKFSELKEAIDHGLKNMDKWYCKTNDTNMYFICLGKCS